MTKITNLKKLVMAALNKCNVTVRQLLDMSDAERVQRRIPMEVVTFVKNNLDESTTTTDQPVDEVAPVDDQPVVEQPVDEVAPVDDQPVDEQTTTETVVEELVVDGDSTRAATDDELKLIKEAVDGNKAKTFAKQLSGLKAKLGADFVDGIDQTQIKEIIEARIAELKGE